MDNLHIEHLTLADAERLAALNGVKLTARDRAAIESAQTHEIKRQKAEHLTLADAEQAPARGGFLGLVDGLNLAAPALTEGIENLGGLVVQLAHSFVATWLASAALGIALIVETQRIFYGITLFEVHQGAALLLAILIVSANALMKVLTMRIEHESGYHQRAKNDPSLGVWWGEIVYFLGMGKGWKARPKSPAYTYRRVQTLTTVVILTLAVSGSMGGVIAVYDGTAWYQAITGILTGSDLSTLLTMIGGVGSALLAVVVSQSLTVYLVGKAADYLAYQRGLGAGADFAIDQDGVDRAGANVILAKLAKHGIDPHGLTPSDGITTPIVMGDPITAQEVHHGPNGNGNGNGTHHGARDFLP